MTTPTTADVGHGSKQQQSMNGTGSPRRAVSSMTPIVWSRTDGSGFKRLALKKMQERPGWESCS